MNAGVLSGQVALVTGSGNLKGIGRGIVDALAAEGAAVVVNYASRKQEAETIAEQLRERGTEVLVCQADISDPAEVERMFAAVLDRFGRLDVLVNNAGVCVWEELVELSVGGFDRMTGINILGTFSAPAGRPGSWSNAGSVGGSSTSPRATPAARAVDQRLRRHEGGDRPALALPGTGARAARHHRQPAVARVRRHRHQRGEARARDRRRSPGAAGHHPHRRGRDPGRPRRRRRVPRGTSGRPRHRRDSQDRRRPTPPVHLKGHEMPTQTLLIACGERDTATTAALTKRFREEGYDVLRSEAAGNDDITAAVAAQHDPIDALVYLSPPPVTGTVLDGGERGAHRARPHRPRRGHPLAPAHRPPHARPRRARPDHARRPHHRAVPTQRFSYCSTSQLALMNLSRGAVLELADRGIRINTILRGWDADRPDQAEHVRELRELHAGDAVPLLGFTDPDEVAKAALLFSDPSMTSLNGALLTLDAGFQISRKIRYS